MLWEITSLNVSIIACSPSGTTVLLHREADSQGVTSRSPSEGGVARASGTEGVVEGNRKEKSMTQKIVGKTYVVYDARAITMSPLDALVLLSTQHKQEAIAYANAYHGAVYSYDIREDAELENETLVHDGVGKG